MTNHKEPLLDLIPKTYSLIDKFIIFGSPASSKNSRTWTGSSSVLGEQAQHYVNIFDKQILRLKPKLHAPYDMREYLWVFEIWYENPRSDASIELIFDLMQKNILIFNDNVIRKYFVSAEHLDAELPRTQISIYKPKQQRRISNDKSGRFEQCVAGKIS